VCQTITPRRRPDPPRHENSPSDAPMKRHPSSSIPHKVGAPVRLFFWRSSQIFTPVPVAQRAHAGRPVGLRIVPGSFCPGGGFLNQTDAPAATPAAARRSRWTANTRAAAPAQKALDYPKQALKPAAQWLGQADPSLRRGLDRCTAVPYMGVCACRASLREDRAYGHRGADVHRRLPPRRPTGCAVSDMIAAIAADPLAGDIIPGSGGARKRRFAGRGRGKSGGYRTVSYFAGDDVPVLLLTLIDKGERADLSGDGRVRVRKILTEYAADYRASVRKRVAVLRGRKDYDPSD
jgi:hypothetical protein